MRWARTENDLTLKHPGFQTAIAELAATVRGWDKDEIVGEDIRQHRRTVRLAWSAAAALGVLALAASLAAVLFLYQRGIARQRELEARQHLYTANVNQALVATRGQDMDRAAQILQLQIPRRGEQDLRGFEWYHLWQQSHRELATFPGLALAHLAFSPDGRLLAVGGAEASPGNARADDSRPFGSVDRGELRIWDIHSGRQQVARSLDRRVSGIAFSPDVRFVAAVTQAGGPAVLEGNDVLLLNAENGEPQWTKREHLNFEAIAFHPSGKFFATAGLGFSAGFQGVVSLWDVENGTQTGTAGGTDRLGSRAGDFAGRRGSRDRMGCWPRRRNVGGVDLESDAARRRTPLEGSVGKHHVDRLLARRHSPDRRRR